MNGNKLSQIGPSFFSSILSLPLYQGTAEGTCTEVVTTPCPPDLNLLSMYVLFIAKLDEIYQAPVALFYLQDYSYNEIAEVLEVPLGTVKSRLTRGLDKLFHLLTDESAGPRPTRNNP